jgi:hypothetical protein
MDRMLNDVLVPPTAPEELIFVVSTSKLSTSRGPLRESCPTSDGARFFDADASPSSTCTEAS